MLDRFGEQLTGLVEIVAGVKEALDLRAVLRPLLDLVEITIVRAQWVVSLFVGPPRHSKFVPAVQSPRGCALCGILCFPTN
jgi:hypothetical protein